MSEYPNKKKYIIVRKSALVAVVIGFLLYSFAVPAALYFGIELGIKNIKESIKEGVLLRHYIDREIKKP